MLRIIALTLACLITSACRRDRPCGDLELDAVRNACVCPGGAAWDVDAGRCGSDAGTLAMVDAGEDAGPEDGGCDAPLGTVDNCTACGDRCGWSCAGPSVGCNDAVEIAAGWHHTCAVRERGDVFCWGANVNGQLGTGSTADEFRPARVSGISDAVAISAATFLSTQYVCAVTRTGFVICWGGNFFGELGDGTTTERTSPVEVEYLRGATAVAAGGGVSCAISTGRVYCWGFGYDEVPVGIPGLPSSAAHVVATSGHFGCGSVEGRGAWCWGSNSMGQLGDGTTIERAAPVQAVDLPAEVTSIATGQNHACAVASGALYCWGDNVTGQLGNGVIDGTSRPTTVPLPNAAVFVAAGDSHTCAILADSSLYCWGANGSGQLGDGSTMTRLAPVPVADVRARRVAVGSSHTCVVTDTGAVLCWGDNFNGQLGDGTTIQRLTPTPIAFE